MRDTKKYTIWDEITPVSVSSSTDADPIVVTANGHGFSDGDLVMIFGHTTNIAANGIYEIDNTTTNTFELNDRYTKEDVSGSGSGAGSGGVVVPAPAILSAKDFRNIELSIVTSGSFNGTVKIAGSLGTPTDDKHGDTPNFGATQDKDNPYDFLQLINLEDGSAVDGDTGITSAGTDLDNTYETNTNAINYVTPIVTDWSAGSITMTAFLTTNK